MWCTVDWHAKEINAVCVDRVIESVEYLSYSNPLKSTPTLYLLIYWWTRGGFDPVQCRRIDRPLTFLWRSLPLWSPQRSSLWPHEEILRGTRLKRGPTQSCILLSFQHLAFSLHRDHSGDCSVLCYLEVALVQVIHSVLFFYFSWWVQRANRLRRSVWHCPYPTTDSGSWDIPRCSQANSKGSEGLCDSF